MEVAVQAGDYASDHAGDADQACPGVSVPGSPHDHLLALLDPKFVRLNVLLKAEHAGGRSHGAQDLIVECKSSLSTCTVDMVLPMKLVMSLFLSPAVWMGKNLRLLVVMMINMSYPDAVIITFLCPSSTVAHRGLADTTTLSLSDPASLCLVKEFNLYFVTVTTSSLLSKALVSLMKSILMSRQGISLTLSVWPGWELVSQPQFCLRLSTTALVNLVNLWWMWLTQLKLCGCDQA